MGRASKRMIRQISTAKILNKRKIQALHCASQKIKVFLMSRKRKTVKLQPPTFHDVAFFCHGSVSAGDALGRERPVTPMSSYYAGCSGCKVT